MNRLWTTTALALMLSAPLTLSHAQAICADGSTPAEGVCADGAAPVEAPAAEAAPATEEAPAAERAPEAEAEAAPTAEAAPEAPAAEATPAEAETEAQAETEAADGETKAERKARQQAERKAERKAAREAKKGAAEEQSAETPATEPAEEAPAAAAAPAEAEAEAQPEAAAETEQTPEAEPAVEAADGETKAERKARRQAERKAERKAAREAEQDAAKEQSAEKPAAEQAPEAPVAAEAQPTEAPDAGMTEEQKAAADAAAAEPTVTPEAAEPAAIVSDEITAEQRAEIAKAERRRRSESRKKRRQLIGAAAAGVAVGVVATKLGGRLVEDQGDRLIVEREDGTYQVRRDENELLRGDGSTVRSELLDDDRQRTTVTRPNGVEVVTLRDGYGNILRRTKRLPNGDEIVLVDNQVIDDERVIFEESLPALRIGVPEEDYIVSAERANEQQLRETFDARPVEQVERVYSLREVRGSQRLREKVRRVDLDAITFDTGSATVTRSQVALLDGIAQAMNATIDADPSALFLVEGHTDAVGSDLPNLALSDRRAETIARILIDVYKVPAENLIVEGYGEQYLKVRTDGAERANRRVTVRNITPLIRG